jgi:hypothetical protein
LANRQVFKHVEGADPHHRIGTDKRRPRYREMVRRDAVSLLAPMPMAGRPAADSERFDAAAKEFMAAQRLNADRPEACTTLANFLAQRGQTPMQKTSTRLRYG